MEERSLHSASSIDEVIEVYKSTVYGIALTRTRNSQDADDIFQDVFLTYHRKQPVFHEEEHRKAWLIKTTTICVKKFFSKNYRGTVELPETLPDESFAFRTDEQNDVYRSLCALSEKYRMVLHLYYFEGLSVEEIAQALGQRPGTVRMQMKRGREIMRSKLEGEYFND